LPTKQIFFTFAKRVRAFWRKNSTFCMADQLKEKTAKGLFWGTINNGVTQVLNLVIGIVLGRILTPHDYGLVGMLTIFTAIAGNLQNFGFTNALVNMKEPKDNDYNAVFWFNILTSLALYTILFFSAPLIARYFHQPQLVALSRVVFLSFVCAAVGIACSGYLFKNLMNREIAIASIVALIVSGTTGIILALKGFAYWSLAVQQIVYILVANLIRFYYCPWRPSFRIDFTPIKRMFNFSVKILITNIINTISGNILTVIFGRIFPANTVGNFTQANKWNTMAYTFVGNSLGQVAQPVLASINDDSDREKRVFRKMMRFTAFLSFPCLLGLALVANEFISVTITDKWAASVPLLRTLCVGGAFMPFYTLYQNLAISHGRSDVYMRCNIAQVCLQIAVILLFMRQGIETMVVAYTIFNILWLLVWHLATRRFIGLHLAEVLKDIVPFAGAAAVVMVATWFATRCIANQWLLLLARIALAVVLYVLIMKLTRARIYKECVAFLFQRFKKTAQ